MVIAAMKILIDQALVFNMLSLVQAKAEFEIIKTVDEYDTTINEAVSNAINALWKDPGIQAVWNRRAEYQITE